MEVINQFLKPKSASNLLCERVTNVDDLVHKTLCVNETRACWERECDDCGIGPLLDAFRQQIGNSVEVMKECRRWGKNGSGNKDLLISRSSVGSILRELENDLSSLAKHVKVAHWQRRQYQ